MAQPQPGNPDPLVQEGGEPPRPPPARQRHDRLQASARRTNSNRPTGIGPKQPNPLNAYQILSICRAFEWREADLNRRHLDFQSSALPAELSRRDHDPSASVGVELLRRAVLAAHRYGLSSSHCRGHDRARTGGSQVVRVAPGMTDEGT